MALVFTDLDGIVRTCDLSGQKESVDPLALKAEWSAQAWGKLADLAGGEEELIQTIKTMDCVGIAITEDQIEQILGV